MRYDAVVIGGGHNGLTAAAYLARAGRSVLVLERSAELGGAARSERVFDGMDARVSTYAYLVSLFPAQIVEELGLAVELRTRRVSSYTPTANGGILIDPGDPSRTAAGLGGDEQAWQDFYAMTGVVAARVFPTVCEPLRPPEDFQQLMGEQAWRDLVEEPIGQALRSRFSDDVVRGIVGTDGLIGTFTSLQAPDRLANRCLLYHVIGRGDGGWQVPVGGMGRVTEELARVATGFGAQLRTECEVTRLRVDGDAATVLLADGTTVTAQLVFAACAPAVLRALLGPTGAWPAPEGSQLKVNLLVSQLPRLRDTVDPERAFTGTVHINESYAQLETAYQQASQGEFPSLPPCEAYCHSLTDPSILSADLAASGAHTLTVFGLHMPARLFRADPGGARRRAVELTLESVNSVLAEPIQDCLATPDCIQASSPVDIEAALGMPGGHIFHGDLQWPWAESASNVGRWGVETSIPNVYLCGAGARRGGGVSGIPGRNAVAAALGEQAVC